VGFTRKMLSVSTMGLIDFRSDKERMARSARLTKQVTRKQNRLVKKQTKQQRQQHQELMTLQRAAMRQPASVPPPPSTPGWYPDVQQPGCVRWWDGAQWTDTVRPVSG
jgi:hypothetical protein